VLFLILDRNRARKVQKRHNLRAMQQMANGLSHTPSNTGPIPGNRHIALIDGYEGQRQNKRALSWLGPRTLATAPPRGTSIIYLEAPALYCA